MPLQWRLPRAPSRRPRATGPRPRADRDALAKAIAALKAAKKPLIIAGGGVRYSGAENALADFAASRGIPVVETIAGKGGLTHFHPVHCGPCCGQWLLTLLPAMLAPSPGRIVDAPLVMPQKRQVPSDDAETT